jgi:ZIP family zinc transporter
MTLEVIAGLLIPLAGTTLGAACMFLFHQQLPRTVERALAGFTVMMALDVALGQ